MESIDFWLHCRTTSQVEKRKGDTDVNVGGVLRHLQEPQCFTSCSRCPCSIGHQLREEIFSWSRNY